MKLRTKYILFVLILHLIAVVLSYFIFAKNQLFFIISEVFIIISLIISWQLYKELIYTSPTGILILDYDDNIQQVNPRALQLLGLAEKEVAGKSLDTFTHPVMQQLKQLRSGEAKTFTFNGIITYKLQKSHFIDRG